MRRSIKILSLLAVAAMTLLGCSKSDEINITKESTTHRVTINASQPSTKTLIVEDGSSIATFKWSTDDASRFVVKENDVVGTDVELTTTDYVKMSLSATFEDVAASSYVYTASLAKNRTSAGFPKIPAEQTSSATSYDPDADIIIAEPMTFSVPQESLSMQFQRPAAIAKMTLKGLAEGETVSKVEVSADKQITGYYDNGTWTGESSTISVLTNQTVSSTGQVAVYFIAMPAEAATLTVTVYTDQNTYGKTFTKTVTFKQNTVASMNVSNLKKTVTTTFTVGQNEGENIYEIASIFPSVKNGVKFTYEQGEGAQPVFYSPFRWYSNNTVTISAGTTALTGITFTFTDEIPDVDISASTGTITLDRDAKTGTWVPAGSESSVTFTNAAGKQYRFTSITVTSVGDGTESVVTSTPTLDFPSEISVHQGAHKSVKATSNYNNGTLVYSSSSSSIATIDQEGTLTGVGQGNTTVSASINGMETEYYIIESVSQNCNVTVLEPADFDILTSVWTGVTTNKYKDWSDKVGTKSTAIYDGNTATVDGSIQFRRAKLDKEAASGIITKVSGGTAQKVVIHWDSSTKKGRTLWIYGKNTAYENVSDLYDEGTQGTYLGEIIKDTSTELVISDNYSYIGIVAKEGNGIKVTEIDITWE